MCLNCHHSWVCLSLPLDYRDHVMNCWSLHLPLLLSLLSSCNPLLEIQLPGVCTPLPHVESHPQACLSLQTQLRIFPIAPNMHGLPHNLVATILTSVPLSNSWNVFLLPFHLFFQQTEIKKLYGLGFPPSTPRPGRLPWLIWPLWLSALPMSFLPAPCVLHGL